MTQIEVTDGDIAEALRLMGRPERIISAAMAIGAFTEPERNFARTLAKLRVAMDALRACRRAVSGSLDEPRRNVRNIVDEALTQITPASDRSV